VDSLAAPTCGAVVAEGTSFGAEPAPYQGLIEVSVAPNPARGEVLFRFSITARYEVAADVYDALGRSRRRLVLDAGPGSWVVRWDCRDNGGKTLPPGVYFLHARFAVPDGAASATAPPPGITRKIVLVP